MRIIFRNLEKSEIAEDAVSERLGDMVEKFPKLKSHKIDITLSMENSPFQAGPDSFGVKVLIHGPVFKNISLQKKSENLYHALADVREHLLEVLNRTGDKMRVVERAKKRKLEMLVEV